jgi:flagellar motor switch protein FliM
MSMQDIHGFEVGQVIALAGADIGGVRAEGPARQLLGQARLGQLNGMRAIRIEAPKAAELQDVEMADPEGAGVSLIGQGVDTRG